MRSKNQFDGKAVNPQTIANRSEEPRSGRDLDDAVLCGQVQTRGATPGSSAPGRDARRVLDAVLTRREREVLRLLAEGDSSKQIADQLGISVNTVNNHRAAIFIRLKVHSVAGALKCYWAARRE